MLSVCQHNFPQIFLENVRHYLRLLSFCRQQFAIQSCFTIRSRERMSTTRCGLLGRRDEFPVFLVVFLRITNRSSGARVHHNDNYYYRTRSHLLAILHTVADHFHVIFRKDFSFFVIHQILSIFRTTHLAFQSNLGFPNINDDYVII